MTDYDFTRVYEGLKDFQKATVEHVFRRLYIDSDATRRFLVADEVGLGKTLVARGVIAKAIEHLNARGVERIDIVYVCSNAAIARQNVQRLNVSEQKDFSLPDRITLLPLHLKHLSQSSLNFISFTPGTALDLKDQGGTYRERALLYWMVRWAWGDQIFEGVRPLNVFQGTIQRTAWWRQYVKDFATAEISRELARAFKKTLAQENQRRLDLGEHRLQHEFRELLEIFTRTDKALHWKERAQRNRFIGRLRALLARTCINELEPDLIILDEFQRFRHLLDGSDPAADLAQALFDYEDARVLLLSATPYKMYTLSEESATDNHYEDFLRTTRFLSPDGSSDFARELAAYRSALLHVSEETMPHALKAKEAVEDRLKKIMSRTERVSITNDRSGMLTERVSSNVEIHPADVKAYLAMQKVATTLDAGDMLEYWKSAPYLLNFMEGYKVALSLNDAHLAGHTSEVAEHLQEGYGLLPEWEHLRTWNMVDPMNARLRALITDVVDSGMWRLLWMPPSLPYYQPEGPYARPGIERTTKRLVFSAWAVVPKAIASLVSYEVERRMVAGEGKPRYLNDPDSRRTVRPLLRFQHTSDRGLQGMSLLTLVYPSFSLAQIADPLDGLRKGLNSKEALLNSVKEEIRRRVQNLVGTSPRSGGVDERWYWAAPLLLDASENADAASSLLISGHLGEAWGSEATDPSEPERSTSTTHVPEPVTWDELRVGESYLIRRHDVGNRQHVYTVVEKSSRWLTARRVTAKGTWRTTTSRIELSLDQVQSIHTLDPDDPRRGPTPELMKVGQYYDARLVSNANWIPYYVEDVLEHGVVLRPVWRMGKERRVEHGRTRTFSWEEIDGSVYPDARFGMSTTQVGGLLGDVLSKTRDVLANPDGLGEPPEDLAEVLTEIAVGSPAICALRALSRVSHQELDDNAFRAQAAGIAWSFRNLFNLPDVSTMLRSESPDVYWRAVLDYCIEGNLQAVLDEYAHVLPEWLGLIDKEGHEVSEKVAETMSEVLGLRAVPYAVDDLQSDGISLRKERHRLRGRFAVRFGDEKSDEGAQLTRASHVRSAFNSPFWPFVLATTSVGQEGLDFHLYCHAVVHWNLPSNPVDLEQREGRVHRYKGHAVRKNLATAYAGRLNGQPDPWEEMFAEASRTRAASETELFPYWLLPVDGGASIERIIPILPLSREQTRLGYLHKTLAAYRLVFGQARQDDLVEYLHNHLDDGFLPLFDLLRIDLSPTREAYSPGMVSTQERESL